MGREEKKMNIEEETDEKIGMANNKRRRSKKTNIDEKTGTMSGMRTIMRSSDGVYLVCIPREFVERNNLKAGDPLPFVCGHVLKFVPMKELE